MKEPSPPTDDVANITSEGEPMPRLITEEEQYQIESNHVEAREKRFAHRLFNITSEDLYVEPTVEPMEVEMPGAPRETARRVSEPCVSVETFYISALAVLFVFVVSIGMVCFFGSHMLKKFVFY